MEEQALEGGDSYMLGTLVLSLCCHSRTEQTSRKVRLIPMFVSLSGGS